ncbi:MAG: PQQ-dependent sugar dehydrogenase, partial [Actinomycetota bacterium]
MFRRFRLFDDVRLQWIVVLALVVAPIALARPQPARAATIPPNFADSLVTQIGRPTGLAFTPDGRMLVTTQGGTVRVFQGNTLLPTPALDLSAKVCSNRERGIASVAIDPNFTSNRRIYLYYTFKKHGVCPTPEDSLDLSQFPVNRVSRFILSDANVINPNDEFVLVDNIPSTGNHNAGDLHFGANGLLYVSVGDGGCRVTDLTRCQSANDNSRSLTHLLGKVLRVRTDGTFSIRNPYAGEADVRRCGDPRGVPAGTGKCGEIFATGLRNPFRMAFKPGTDTFHINDVGGATWEEVNLGIKGADYGWNVREGHCLRGSRTDCPPPGAFTDPIYD